MDFYINSQDFNLGFKKKGVFDTKEFITPKYSNPLTPRKKNLDKQPNNQPNNQPIKHFINERTQSK